MNRWLWGSLVALVYAASFALPAYLDLDGHEAFAAAAHAGLDAWSNGEVGQELLGWLPNPFLWVGVVLLLGGQGQAAALAGLTALLGASSWLSLADLLPGYYVWLGSMGLLLAGGVWLATSATEEEIV